MPNPTCQRLFERLSAYVDGELSEKKSVEDHLPGCEACRLRVADLQAQSRLMQAALSAQVDRVDFSGFKDDVLARISFAGAPARKRRGSVFAGRSSLQKGLFAGALAACAAGIVFLLPIRPGVAPADGYGSPEVAVRMVSTDAEAHVAPLVINAENGDAIIWLVPHAHDPALEGALQDPPKNSQTPPHSKGGDL